MAVHSTGPKRHRSSIMKRLTIGIVLGGTFAARSFALPFTAEAAPIGGQSASDAINELRADGYNVQLNLNSTRDVPLSECIVSGVHGIPATAPVGGQPVSYGQFTTVYVYVDCL